MNSRLPKELIELPQWVIWRNVDGKKIPYVASGLGYTAASSTNPKTWRSFSQAKDVQQGQGVGFVFTQEDGIIGVDLDHCIKGGKISSEAQQICRALRGYTEVSPGGDGLHIYVRGSLGGLAGLNAHGVEIYDKKRYFTFGGKPVFVPEKLPEKSKEVLRLYKLCSGKPKKAVEKVPVGQRNSTLMKIAGSLRRSGVPLEEARIALQSVNESWCANGGVPNSEIDTMLRGYTKLKGAELGGAVPIQTSTMAELEEFFGSVKWAWQDWIPKGYLTMIVGPQAVGKSFFAAHLAAIMSSGERWPDGTPGKKKMTVLIIETEGMKGVWVERLKLADANPENIIVLGDEAELIDIEERFQGIVATCEEQKPDVLIIDSLSAGHALKENDAHMRTLLKKYAELAASFKIPILLVHHTRKRAREESVEVTLDRVRGSSTITQLCRSVIVLYTYENTGITKAESVKSNLCKLPSSFGFTITGRGLTFGDAPVAPVKRTAVGDAGEFLEELLADGPVPSKQVYEEGEKAGFSKSSLRRAKKALDIQPYKDGVWYWKMPGEFEIHLGVGGGSAGDGWAG